MSYVPNTDADRRKMLDKIGVKDFEELISKIPEAIRLKRPLEITPLPEMTLLKEIEQLTHNNATDLACFAGGGVYDHFIPAAVNAVISRPEFMTAYTPYQPEVAQGTLQVIYEFQTHICRLTGMDVANASMYDGASAAAEAVIISCAVTKRNKIIVSETVSPFYRQVITTYLSGREIEKVMIPMKNGLTDIEAVIDAIDDKTACVMLSQPNFFGLLEDIDAISKKIHEVGGKLIVSVDPVAQAILKTPAEYGADIVVGEGQPLGIPLSFGGPLLGFFAAKKDLIRNMPGRISARTNDVDGRTGFVLTLQTREQHIRREKATSNICTNQALCATAASVYISLMGKTGLKNVALLSAEKAHQTAEMIFALEGFEPYFEGAFVREFPVKVPGKVRDVIASMIDRGVLPGIDAGRWYPGLDNCLIVALTEKRTSAEIEILVNGLKEQVTDHAVSRMPK